MNRRNFLANIAKSFFILPGAGRVWKTTTVIAVDLESHMHNKLPLWFEQLYADSAIESNIMSFLRWEKVISQTGWPANLGDVTRTTEEIMREHCAKHNIPIPSRLGPSTGIAVVRNPPII